MISRARLKKATKSRRKTVRTGAPNLRALERASQNASFKRGSVGGKGTLPKPPSDAARGLKPPTQAPKPPGWSSTPSPWPAPSPLKPPTQAPKPPGTGPYPSPWPVRAQPGEAIAKRTGSPYAARAFAATRRKLPQPPRGIGRAKGMTK
jgi:hypothetical protein